MADPRTHLPEGIWRVERTGVRPSKHPILPPTFAITASDAASGDRVSALVAIGKQSAEYTLEEWGLPAAIPWDRVWHLARIEPRVERATGGTKAVVRFLADQADMHGVWLTTEVKTSQESDGVVMALLAKHGDFVSPGPEYAEMMIRGPR